MCSIDSLQEVFNRFDYISFLVMNMKTRFRAMKWIYALGIGLLYGLCSCSANQAQAQGFVRENVDFARRQIGQAIEVIEAAGECLNPVHLKPDGTVYYCKYSDWRSGFFPGSVWLLYELSGDTSLLPLARKYTEAIRAVKDITWSHDIGFMAGCSFGNGFRLTGDSAYAAVLVQAARSLATRFRPEAGVLQSWNVDKGWQSRRGWECPVIIDNMMNLELLFQATRLTGDSTYYHMAVSHAERTMQEHFRPDGSTFHVVDYSLSDGTVRSRCTAQGYADSSVWSRGQAWTIYGYTVCYRETGCRRYLDQALRTYNLMKNHPRMPDDCIPYWDMDAPDIPQAPRDASSAACIASALYELSTFGIPQAAECKAYADRILAALASPVYRAPLGSNGHFLLMHSVGSIPHHAEVDVPLNYADYYFLEALIRKAAIDRIK